MWEVAFQDYVLSGQDSMVDMGVVDMAVVADIGAKGVRTGPQNLYQASEYIDPDDPDQPPPPDVPTTDEEFVAEVTEILTGTGGTISAADLDLISSDEWMQFLNALFGFVTTVTGGADQNSYYNDHSNEAPLGEYFIEQWGFLPSIRQMPGYHYYDYLTQDIDPEFLEMAYGIHSNLAAYTNAGGSLANIENLPFTLVIDGSPISVTWHSGTAPVSNLSANPFDPNEIIVTASYGYFTVDPQADDIIPRAFDFMDLTTENAPYLRFAEEALRYLDDSPLAMQLLRAAMAAGTKIVIVTGNVDSRYDTISNTVFWNPGMAIRLSNGGIMSPAMALIHELAHAIGGIRNPAPDSQYGNVEERRVIETYEHVIAQQLGEPIRNDHLGSPVFGIGTVTYHAPPPPGGS